jgi:hypothetical protein
LSGSHSKLDICDALAAGGPSGDGVYPADQVPTYPAHPHDLCNLQPQVMGNPAAVTRQMRERIGKGDPEVMALQGAFNAAWAVEALLTGLFIDEVIGVLT